VEIKKIYLVGKYPEQIYLMQNQIKNGDFNFEIVSEIKDCDIYLAFDLIDTLFLNNPINQAILKVLIRQEPKIVLSDTYTNRNIGRFDYIFDIGKPKSSKLKVLNWPQNLSQYGNNQRSKKDRVVLVNSNLLSLAKGENYSLRRKSIKYIEQLDLYGYNWNNSLINKIKILFIELKKFTFKFPELKILGIRHFFKNYNNYLGEINNKREVMSTYKYALVIENSSEYMSEKLFDSLLSGCIPIYVGPDLTKYEIPRSLYLQAQPNLDDIRSKINEAKKINYNEWVENLHIWLSESKTYENWSEHLFLSKILKLVKGATNNNHLQP